MRLLTLKKCNTVLFFLVFLFCFCFFIFFILCSYTGVFLVCFCFYRVVVFFKDRLEVDQPHFNRSTQNLQKKNLNKNKRGRRITKYRDDNNFFLYSDHLVMAIFCYLHISKWLAFSSLHKPLFSEHSSVYFANSQWPAAGHNRAHCNVQLNLEELFQTQCIFFFS